jgi:heat shock protein HtpX
MTNTAKTAVLLGALTGLLLLLGSAVGGQQGMMVAFILAAAINFGSYWFSDRIVLAMYGAREVSEAEAPELHQAVRRLAQRAQVPMPRVYVVPGDAPNAFATGRDPAHAAVAVTEGIVRILTPEELEGVLAHELAHVRNRDTLISAVAATLAGVVTMLAHMLRWGAFLGAARDEEEGEGGGNFAWMIAMAIVAPIAALLIQMAISRAREFVADATAAALTKKPWALASSLEKLEVAANHLPALTANPAAAHMCIVNPLRGSALFNLFSTHPPTEERIARLRAMRA